jgi:putative nucleotidyltransferase with HDIG domain
VTTSAPTAAAALSAREVPEEELIEAHRAAMRERVRKLLLTVALAATFVCACTALLVLAPTRPVAVLPLVLAVATYALSMNAYFEVGIGVAVPTQLFFVAMWFLVPAGLLAPAVALAAVVAALPDVARRRMPVERLLVHVYGSWYAIGPAVVLALFGSRTPHLDAWPVYTLALAGQALLNFASQAPGVRSSGFGVRAQLRMMAPALAVDAALAPVGLVIAFAVTPHPALLLLVLPLVGLLAYFARERRMRIDHALELSQAYRGTAFLLGDVIEADDAYTGSHSRDVVELSRSVAERLGVGGRDVRKAELTALLHDVGKIRIPAEIINKPEPLTAEERAIIETHTVEGERLLARVGGLLAEVGTIVRSCHERWDGGGYPDGLAGEEIPVVARIVCCCDAFNAMTTDRPYRRARTVDDALAELGRCSGSHFDPAVAAALAAVVRGGMSPAAAELATAS